MIRLWWIDGFSCVVMILDGFETELKELDGMEKLQKSKEFKIRVYPVNGPCRMSTDTLRTPK